MWSPQQTRALDLVGRWLQTKDKPFFQLAGYAGTGKTTLAKHLAENVPGEVYFAAYTGKAAHVLAKAGARNVSTIHKLIYTPKDKSQKRLRDLIEERKQLTLQDPLPTNLIQKVDRAIAEERVNLTRPMFQLNLDSPLYGAALLVVDEYSMIDEQMGTDLLSFGCPILALGDPGQLPPVRGRSFFNDKPDLLLTEIHRQAADNPIIWLSKEVREGRALHPGTYGESRVTPAQDMPKEELQGLVLGLDQLLVGRNATRTTSNRRARELLGRTEETPRLGDKLVCLRNNHQEGCLNGQIWTAARDAVASQEGDYVELRIEDEGGVKIDLTAHACYFRGSAPDNWTRKDAEEFDYGYALTVHKAQGSQWDSVLLFDEWYGRDRAQWLYTAITRAAERLELIMM